MGPDGAVNIVFRREIEAAEDREARRQELVEEYRQNLANPYVSASRGFIDDVIDPRDTRIKIIRALEMLQKQDGQQSAQEAWQTSRYGLVQRQGEG